MKENRFSGIIVSEGSQEKKGSFFLVSCSHLVTCWHVLEHIACPIAVLNGEQIPIKVSREVKELDLAICELSFPPSNASPLAFVSGVGKEHDDFLKNSALIYVPRVGSLNVIHVEYSDSDLEMDNMQFHGGFSGGFSGSPVLIESAGIPYCLGMLKLGREASATSRMLASDGMLAALQRIGIPGAGVFETTPFPELQRNGIKSKTPILIAGRKHAVRKPELPSDWDLGESQFVGREWLFEIVDSKIDDTAKRGVVLFGDMGTGKSAFMSELFAKLPFSKVLCAYSCNGRIPETLLPLSFFHDLAEMAAFSLPGFLDRLDQALKQNHANNDGSTRSRPAFPTEEKDSFRYGKAVCSTLAKTPAPPSGSMVLMIDAMDESITAGKAALIDLLMFLIPLLPKWVKIVVTSRPAKEVENLAAAASLDKEIIDPPSELNQNDVIRYIRKRCGSPTVKKKIGRESNLVQNMLLGKSNGNFQYLAQAFRTLEQDGDIDEDNVLAVLEQVPVGLKPLYEYEFRRRFPSGDLFESFRPTLEILMAAREPMQIDMLKCLYEEHPRLGSGQIPLKTILYGLSFVLHTRSGKMRFNHSTIPEWLSDSEWLDSPRSSFFLIDAAKGHGYLSDFLLKRYHSGSSDFESYLMRHLPSHLTSAGRKGDLHQLICNFKFIDRKIQAGLFPSLLSDFEEGIKLYAGSPDQSSEAEEPFWDDFAQEMAAFVAEAVDRIRNPEGRPNDGGKKMPIPPKLACHTMDFLESKRTVALSGMTALVIMVDFFDFLSKQSGAIWHYSNQPGFCVQQAINYANEGPVVRVAREELESSGTPYLELSAAHRWFPGLPIRKIFSGKSLETAAISARGEFVFSANLIAAQKIQKHSAFSGELVGSTDIPYGSLPLFGRISFSAFGDIAVVKNPFCIFDTATGEVLRDRVNGKRKITCIQFFLDGKSCIVGDENGSLSLLDICSETADLVIYQGSLAITSLWAPPTLKFVLAFRNDGSAVYLDLASRAWEVVQVTRGEKITSIEGNLDGSGALFFGDSGSLYFWDLVKGNTSIFFKGPAMAVALKVLNQSLLIAVGFEDGMLRLFDFDGSEKKCFRAHSERITSLSCSADGHVLASTSMDGDIALFDLKYVECLQNHFDGTIFCSKFTRAGLVTVSANDFTHKNISVIFSDPNEGAIASAPDQLTGHENAVTCVDISLNGDTILTADQGGRLFVWDMKAGAGKNVVADNSFILAAKISPDGKFGVTGGGDCNLKVWDLATKECTKILESSKDEDEVGYNILLCKDRFSGRQNMQMQSEQKGRAVIWTENGIEDEFGKKIFMPRLGWTPGGHDCIINCAAISKDAEVVISGDSNGSIIFWSPFKDTPPLTLSNFHSGGVEDIVIAPDGKRAVSVGGDCIHYWDLYDRRSIKKFSGHVGRIKMADISPNGEFLLTHDQRTLILWDLVELKDVAIFHDFSAAFSIRFAEDRIFFMAQRGAVQKGRIANLPRSNHKAGGEL